MWADKEIFGYLSQGAIPFPDFISSYQFVTEKSKTIQIQTVSPNLQEVLNQKPTVLGVSWADFLPRVNRADNGSNEDVEEIEFSYIYHGIVVFLTHTWLAFRFTGFTSDQSFKTITGIDYEDRQINTLGKLYSEIYNSMSRYFERSLDNRTQIGIYTRLPNLW